MIMPSTETIAQKRDRRAVEGQEAWNQYYAEQKHIDDNMHRLRALRLAREAQEATAVQPVKKRKVKTA
jgi:hypothetical protein